MLKPDAVYFGEDLPSVQIKRAIALSRAAKAFLIVGTSGQVAPACKLPKMAKDIGRAKVIEVSPRETDLTADADLLLMGPAAEVLPELFEAVQRLLSKASTVSPSSSEASKPPRAASLSQECGVH